MVKMPLVPLCLAALMLQPALGQSVTEVQDVCEGELSVPHDDGTYSFMTESWRRTRANAQYYGRCIEVVPPTRKLANSWINVLPKNSIARTGRPTIDGDEFPDVDTVTASARLYYGNSDDMIDATYLAHASEISTAATGETPSFLDQIKDALERTGIFEIFSFKQTSFLIVPDDEESIADLTLSLRSAIEGSSLTYVAEYNLSIENPDYAGADLDLSFASSRVTDALSGTTDFRTIKLTPGVNAVTFRRGDVEAAGFVRTQIDVLRSGEAVLLSMPANVLVAVDTR